MITTISSVSVYVGSAGYRWKGSNVVYLEVYLVLYCRHEMDRCHAQEDERQQACVATAPVLVLNEEARCCGEVVAHAAGDLAVFRCRLHSEYPRCGRPGTS